MAACRRALSGRETQRTQASSSSIALLLSCDTEWGWQALTCGMPTCPLLHSPILKPSRFHGTMRISFLTLAMHRFTSEMVASPLISIAQACGAGRSRPACIESGTIGASMKRQRSACLPRRLSGAADQRRALCDDSPA